MHKAIISHNCFGASVTTSFVLIGNLREFSLSAIANQFKKVRYLNPSMSLLRNLMNNEKDFLTWNHMASYIRNGSSHLHCSPSGRCSNAKLSSYEIKHQKVDLK